MTPPNRPGLSTAACTLSNTDILAVFINDPLVARPGERVSYSTFGYTLASIVLETAAKLPFLELVQRDIADAARARRPWAAMRPCRS